MTLKEIEDANGSIRKVLTECPWCGLYFGDEPNGSVRTDHFLHDHGPEVLDPDYEPEERVAKLDEFVV